MSRHQQKVIEGQRFEFGANWARFLELLNAWHDVIDWVGGFPFEVARPVEIFDIYHTRGYQLDRLRTCTGGKGCNEFVFTLSDKPRSVE